MGEAIQGPPSAPKPPLGLRPQEQWKRERRTEIYEAMERYINACKTIPYEWLRELKYLNEHPF